MMLGTVGNQRSYSWRHEDTQTHKYMHMYMHTHNQYEDMRRERGCSVTRLIGQTGVFILLLGNDSYYIVYMCVLVFFFSLRHDCVYVLPHLPSGIMITVFRYTVPMPVVFYCKVQDLGYLRVDLSIELKAACRREKVGIYSFTVMLI